MVKTVSERPVPVPSVSKILAEAASKRDLSTIEQITLEYAKKFSKLPPEKAEAVFKELVEMGIPIQVAVQIVNIVPTTRDELRVLLAPLPRVFESEDLDKILALLKESSEG